MTISRIDLDGFDSPTTIAARIHALLPRLQPNFSVEALCKRFDIEQIQDVPITSFAAALLMHPDKAWGSIIVAEGTPSQRRRFSIAHELGHFLLPQHRPDRGEHFSCSHADLQFADTRENDRHKRMEAEANRFAAQLLMPPSRIEAIVGTRPPDLTEVVRLAREFNVSKEAMARSYAEAHRGSIAVVIVCDGQVARLYRPEGFPWIRLRVGEAVPQESLRTVYRLAAGTVSEMAPCEPGAWLSPSAARRVEVLREQVLAQQLGYATILLHAGFVATS